MILAVPSETGQGLASIRSGHFGHTPWFTLVEIEDGKVKSATPVKNADHDTVGCGGVIEYVASLGIDAILTAGMGRPPFMRFSNMGIKVYLENHTPYVGDVVDKFIKGECVRMSFDDACNHHH